MDIHRFIHTLRQHSYLILLIMLTTGLITYGMNARKAPLYASTTTFFLEQPAEADQRPSYDTLLLNERLAPTYTELIRSPSVLDRVIIELQLATNQKTLLENTEIIVVRNTQLLQLQVKDGNAQAAADTANAIITIFNMQQAANHQMQVSLRQKQFVAELGQVQANIDRTQRQLQAAQANNSNESQRLGDLLIRYQNDYDSLNEHIAQAQNAVNALGLQLKVVEPARPVPISILPSKTILVGLGTIFGALLAITLALAFELFNTRIRDRDDAAGLQNIRLLHPLLSTDRQLSSTSAFAMYHELWLHSTREAGEAARCWLITSVEPAADTSAVVMLLGSALAQSGRRVVLVDAKFEYPTLHILFEQSNAAGLSSALQQARSSVRQYLLPVINRDLLLLPSGPAVPNVSSLLAGRHFETLVNQLRRQYDTVLFHTPASAISIDAAVIGRVCDVALLVVQAGVTRKEPLMRAAEQLAAGGVGSIQAVLAKRERGALPLIAWSVRLLVRAHAIAEGWRLRFTSPLQPYSSSRKTPPVK